MRSARAGVSLLEVLISIFVVMFGLLGLAALLPVGRFAIVETGKADRSGACGRAAQRDIKIRQLLDPLHMQHPWSNPGVLNTGRPFAIDPRGVARGLNKLGNLPLISYAGMSEQMADLIFTWRDDLIFDMPEDVTLRPEGMFTVNSDGDALIDNPTYPSPKEPWAGTAYEGSYSWLMTVAPARGEAALTNPFQKNLYSVSVVVCYKRTFTDESEQTHNVLKFYGAGLGGGSLRLAEPINIRENEWIMLYAQKQQQANNRVLADCKWYRVVSAGKSKTDLRGPDMLTLVGPDWDVRNFPAGQTQLVVVDGVIGVYSTTVELDRFSVWSGTVTGGVEIQSAE